MKRGSGKAGKPKAGPGRIKRYGGAGVKVDQQANLAISENVSADPNDVVGPNTALTSNEWPDEGGELEP
jgi:hypothetical protein